MVAAGTDEAVPESAAADLLDSDQAGPTAIRGGAIRLLAFAATVALSVIPFALLSRHLGVVASGHYVTIVSLVTLCGGLTDAGLSAIGVRELATRDAAARRGLMGSLNGLRLTLALVGVTVAVAFSVIAGYGTTLVLGTVIAGVGMLLTVLGDTYAISLTVALRMSWLAASDLLRVLVLAIAIVLLVVAGAGLLPFYAAAIPAAGAAGVLTGWLVRKDVPLMPAFKPSHWRSLLRDTLAFSVATAVIAVYFRVAIIVVSLTSSGRQTGYFGVSFRVVEVLLSVPAVLVGVTFPIFARAARDDHVRLSYAVGRVCDTLWLLGLGVGLAMFVGAPFVISVIAGPMFHPAEAVLRIQGLALIASFIGSVWAYTLLSLNRHREILIVSLAALLLTVVLTATLSSIDGARGAAIATALTEALFVLMLGGAVFHSGLRPAITWSALPRSVAAALIGAATVAIPDIPVVAKTVLALAVYAGALIVLRAVPREIVEQLRR
jgi:O-antigen/teichoic acid export membrane protein